ncbi:rhamnulokinase [Bianquea renquensis]|jgi:rhamnulokinase|uniref:Rhamnulokinase n=1 Tax=Bianquea renquensis TaxID=2763661 RepID=A0A926DQE9_9FIRM|nr:rhamnulokinase family protein [Bianquea renquensis]MBC8542641.1 rhamnulokinase [Bianquea renquensis]
MSTKTAYLAFDYGASSGRLMLCCYDGHTIDLEEIYRFPNEPVWMNGHFYWDFPRLFHEMKMGLKKAASLDVEIAGIGIDTWGVDYGYLDEDGRLISNPFCYRDPKNAKAMDEMDVVHPFKEFYEIAGLQKMDFNTAYQVYYDVQHRHYILDCAKTFLFMPDLFAYFLTGRKACEYSIASTSQMLDARTRNWSDALLEKIGISREILPEIVEPGTVLGELTDEIVEETGMKKVPVIAVGCHDTASAVCAAPLESENSVFISSGTWSLMGMEVREPIITEKSLQYNFTNEGGVEGTIRFLKNISGLWIIQNLKKKWEEKQPDVSYMLIENEARSAERRHFIIDPDDARFMAPMNMVKEVQNYCEEQGQGRPETIGEIALAVYNGLAEKYRQNVVDIEEITGKTVDVINIVGGGTKDRLLCAMTAASTGKAVKVGPVEAAVLGNVLMQMKALGQLKDVAEGREIIKRSFPIETFN